jgi:hypothetical protein
MVGSEADRALRGQARQSDRGGRAANGITASSMVLSLVRMKFVSSRIDTQR